MLLHCLLCNLQLPMVVVVAASSLPSSSLWESESVRLSLCILELGFGRKLKTRHAF